MKSTYLIKIYVVIFICFINIKAFACQNDDAIITIDTLKPIVVNITDHQILFSDLQSMDSIRIVDKNTHMVISGFCISIIKDSKPKKSYFFKGSVAPNIFKKQRLLYFDKNNVEYSPYDGFQLTTFYLDNTKNKFKSHPIMNYFAVKRTN